MGMDPLTGGLILGGAGLLGQTASGLIGANSRENAAQAQRDAAMAAAEPSVTELAAMQKQLRVADQSLARQEALVKAIDPALMEAGRQALDLLQGKEAGALAPLRAAQARQTAMARSQLEQQLGSGFETSSAGIEALTRLQESQLGQQQQAQQQTLGSLLGISAQVRPSEANIMAAGSVEAQQQAMLAQRRVSAIAGNPLQPAGVGQADTLGSLFGGLSQMGGMIYGQAAMDKRFADLSGSYRPAASGTSFGNTSSGYGLGVNTSPWRT